jgi:hypothetical protein
LHLNGALVALVGLLGQSGQHDRVQCRAYLRVAQRGRLGRLAHVSGGDRHLRAVGSQPERRAAGEQLIQHTPQAIQVCPGIYRPASGLLGGQVGGRAQHRPGAGQGHEGRRLDDAEVGHFHPPVGTNQHVAGFDVAVHQPLGVGGGQRRAHLDGQLGGPAGRQRALPLQQLGQTLTRHVLHHQIVEPRIGTAVEHRHDVGVAQSGCGAGLAAEPFDEQRILGIGRAEHLDRHLSLQHPISGQVHAGHPAGSQQRAELVAAVKGPSLQVLHAQTLSGSDHQRPSDPLPSPNQERSAGRAAWVGSSPGPPPAPSAPPVSVVGRPVAGTSRCHRSRPAAAYRLSRPVGRT